MLCAGWMAGRPPRGHLVAPQVRDNVVYVPVRVARYAQWCDLPISASHPGPCAWLVAVDEPAMLLDLVGGERTHSGVGYAEGAQGRGGRRRGDIIRSRRGAPMSQPQAERPGPPPVLLVAYGTGPMSDAQLHLACRSATDIGGTVLVLHVIERSRHIPLSAPLAPHEQAQVDAVLDRAERIAHRYAVPCHLEAHQAGAVGPAIIEAAVEYRAQTIFIGLRDRARPGAALLLSATVRHILQHAPCPVQIGYLPARLPDEGARDLTGRGVAP